MGNPIYNTYINLLTFYKLYTYLTTASFKADGYILLLYLSTSVYYTSIDIMLSQYNNSNVYIQNTSSYYYINITKLDIGNGLLLKSIHLTIDGTLYIDSNFTLFLSGTLNNCGNIIYDVGTIIITSQSVIDSIASNQWSLFKYKTIVNIQLYNILCNIKSYLFKYSTNPTLYATNSVLLSQYTASYQPYITTIRLYDSNDIHIATTTLSYPMKKSKEVDQTIKIKLLNYI